MTKYKPVSVRLRNFYPLLSYRGPFSEDLLMLNYWTEIYDHVVVGPRLLQPEEALSEKKLSDQTLTVI